jgi:galactokinase
VHGAAGSALLLDCATLTAREVPIPPGATFLIIDSGVRRRLEDSQYGQRRAELERALASVDSDPVSPRRLRHVVSENERVTDFAAALELDDLESAGELISESHRSLRDDYEVSTPELDALVDLAVRSGALGARLVGGGFGGSVLALVEAGRAEAVRRALGREALVVEPSAGAHQ